jgi:hypothetical protein
MFPVLNGSKDVEKAIFIPGLGLFRFHDVGE